LKILFQNIIDSNRKTLLLNWESLKKEWATLSIFLDSKKVYARWVPRKLTDEVKAEKLGVSREVRGHFEEGGFRFLQQLVIGDETWVHHYDPEYKRHSIEYCHKASPVPKKYKTKASFGKIMLTVLVHS
jgi:hypothetical protein